MHTVRLNYNGEYFDVFVDEETHTELLNDPAKLSLYAEQAYNLVYPDSLQDTAPSGEPLLGPSNALIDLPCLPGSSNEDSFKWSNALTTLLIEKRLSKENDFNRPVCKKKKLWEHIAREIRSITEVAVTSDMCDIKYRNVLATYKTNKKKSQQSGEGSINWEYYTKFDEILGCKASILPDPKLLGDIEGLSRSTDTDIDTVKENEEPCNKKNEERRRKRKNSLEIGEYLWMKQHTESERKLKKEKKKEEERWKEKRALKEREIQAIENLAAAISKSKG